MKFEEIKEKLGSNSIGIAGCGGLGSNCAVSLARVGLGNLIIADFDIIEESNLNRQYYFYNQIGLPKAETLKTNINLINPKCNVESHNLLLNEDLIKSIYSKCDVIVEAFDKAEMKKMIIETILEFFPEKPVISGSGMAGWGNNDKITVKNYGNLYIVGDGIAEVSEENPPLAPRVCVVSNLMANIVLEILLGKE